MQDLPEPLKASKTLKRYADKATLADAYIELERRLGRSAVIPGKDAKPEEWESLFSRLGRPKTANDYALTPFAGFQSDPVLDAAFKAEAFKKGVSADAAQALYATVTQRIVQDEDARKAEVIRKQAGALEALKSSLGDQYQPGLELAHKTYAIVFSPEAMAVFKDAGLEDNPVFIQDLIKLGKRFGNDSLVEGNPVNKKPDPYDWMRERYGGGRQ
jgi:hypothetical protein